MACSFVFDSEELFLFRTECPARCSGGRRPLIAGFMCVQTAGHKPGGRKYKSIIHDAFHHVLDVCLQGQSIPWVLVPPETWSGLTRSPLIVILIILSIIITILVMLIMLSTMIIIIIIMIQSGIRTPDLLHPRADSSANRAIGATVNVSRRTLKPICSRLKSFETNV